jgi:hypothetical protein
MTEFMKSLIFLALVATTAANDSAINSGGHGPSPLGEFQGEESVIRMVSERIDIKFGKDQSEVTCRFTFRSTKKEDDAKQTVGFPDFIDTDTDRGHISELKTFVDGQPVEAKKVRGWFGAGLKGNLGDPPAVLGEEVQRADFFVVDVTFPPDKDVIVERRYIADNGGNVMGNKNLSYVTSTGAVWQGTIGVAEFHVKLDGWTVDDLAFEDGKQKRSPRLQVGPWCEPNLAEWKVVSPTELTMTWKDFEPAVHKTRCGIMLSTWSQRPES